MSPLANQTPTREALLDRCAALLPELRGRAAATEQLRRVPDENVAALVDSGLTKIAVPKTFGGLDVGYDLMLEVSIELAKACGSTSWCYSLWGAHAWLAGYMPIEAQQEVWADGAEVLLANVGFSRPGSALTPQPGGGYRLSGHWEFASGIDAAGWAMLSAQTPTGRTRVILPRADYTIEDTWHVMGLRGTGSKDIVVDDVFVPEHRVMHNMAEVGGTDFTAWEHHQQPQFRVPIAALLVWDLVTPAVGLAYAAIENFTERLSNTTGRFRSKDSTVVHLRLAEASAEADVARMLVLNDVREMLDKGARGEPFTPLEIARYQRDKNYAMKLSIQAVERLFGSSGGHSLFEDDPMQRIHRDVIAAGHRDGLVFDYGAQQFGKVALGLPADSMIG